MRTKCKRCGNDFCEYRYSLYMVVLSIGKKRTAIKYKQPNLDKIQEQIDKWKQRAKVTPCSLPDSRKGSAE